MMERDSRMTGNVNRQLVFSTNEAEIKAPEQFGRNSAWELEHFY